MYDEALLESLIEKIYEAAVGAAGWADLLRCLGSAFDGDYPALFLANPSTPESTLALCLGFGEKTRRSYDDHYAGRNVWMQGARAGNLLKPGLVRLTQQMCSRQDFLRSEWYADFCRPLGFTQGIALTILDEGGVTSNIGIFTDGRRRIYAEEECVLMRALFPHLHRGLKMHTHLAARRTRSQALEEVLHGLSVPVMLASAKGELIFINAAAEQLIRAADGLRVEAGTLRALLPGDTRPLHLLLGGAARTSAGKGRKPGGTLRIARPYGREPLELLISPLPCHADDWLASQCPVAAVFVIDPTRSAVAQDSVLFRLYGLTPAEVKVACALAHGSGGKQACRELHITYNTLKTHLKRIYEKTRTRSRADLVRLLAISAVPDLDMTGESAGWRKSGAHHRRAGTDG
jgi:DNA-binding CsgD family transcriptional regulator